MKKTTVVLLVVFSAIVFFVVLGLNLKKEYEIHTAYETESEDGITTTVHNIREEFNEQLKEADLYRYIVFQNESMTYVKLTKKQREELGELPIFKKYDMPSIKQDEYDKDNFGNFEDNSALGL